MVTPENLPPTKTQNAPAVRLCDHKFECKIPGMLEVQPPEKKNPSTVQ